MAIVGKNGPITLPPASYDYDILRISLDNAISGPDAGRGDRVDAAIASARAGIIWYPVFFTLSLAPSTPKQFLAWSTAIIDRVTGSTIVATSSDGTVLTVAGNQIAGTFLTGGAKDFTLTESKVGSVDKITVIPNAVTVSVVPAFAYQAETTALTAAFTTPPTTRRKKSIDWAIRTLKGANYDGVNVWPKLLGFGILGATDEQSALLNWKTATAITKIGLPLFTVDSGYANWATTKYLNTLIPLNVMATNNCYIGVFCPGGGASGNAFGDVGAIDSAGAGLCVSPRNTTTTLPQGAAGGPFVASISSDPTAWVGDGLTALGRLPTDAGNLRAYRGPVNRGSTANVAAANFASATNIYIGATNNNGAVSTAGAKPIFAWVVSAGLTDIENKVLAAVIRELYFERQYGELDDYEPGYLPASSTYDVIVYGATSGAVAAAFEHKRQGMSVAIVSDYRERVLGGMSSGGLGAIDWAPASLNTGLGGLPLWMLRQATASHTMDCALFRAACHKMFDPRIAASGLDIPVFWSDGIATVKKTGTTINSFVTNDGRSFAANTGFVDASYAGDLLRLANCTLFAGREAAGSGAEVRNGWRGLATQAGHEYKVGPNGFGAVLNIDPWIVPNTPASGVLPDLSGNIAVGTPALGAQDGRNQCFNFRLTIATNKNFMIPWPNVAPPGYTAARYEAMGRWLVAAPALDLETIFNLVVAGSGKQDWNTDCGLSTDLANSGTRYLNAASYAEREIVQKDIENYIRGLMYYLTYDPDARVATHPIRAATLATGMSATDYTRVNIRDDFYWMTQLYIRGLYRLVGDFIWDANDLATIDGTIPRSTNTAGVAAYQFDNHYNSSWADNSTGTWRIFKEGESNDEGLGTNPAGGVDLMTPIPMEVMWPKRVECVNVLTPWSCSMTSLAFSSARMEPSLMGLGQFTAFPMAQRKASGNVMALQDTVYATARAAALASPTLAGEVAPVLPQVN